MRTRQLTVGTVSAVLFGMLLAAGAPAWAGTTYCVATNNSNDSYPGTNWAQPFKTITNAIRIAQSGDTVLVTNGTYTYSANGLSTGNGKAIKITNGITLRSVNGYAVTIIKPGSGYSDDGDGAVIINHANAVFDGFRVTASYSGNAGGISLTTGLVQNCWIDSNNGYRGGGVCLYGAKDAATAYKATVRNCMIVANTGRDVSGGGGAHWYNNYAGIVDSCTIIKNAGAGGGGVRNANTGGTIQNSIVHGNSSTGAKQNFNWTAATAGILNNCITVDYTTGGTGNTTNDPSFKDWSGGDYRLNPNSPCRDTGNAQAWMAGTNDLGGVVARIMPVAGGTNDMGCFEFDTDALICSLSATPLYGFPALSVTLTSSVSGNTNGLFYRWDLRADGSFEVEGADKAGFTTNLDIGLYSIALTITNALGSSASTTNFNYVKVGPPTNYVDAAGPNPVSPYTTWATASTNIQKALDLGVPGTLTLVTNGIYNAPTNNCITNDMGITLRSMNGYAYTTIQELAVTNYLGPGMLRIDHASAVVDGFTLTCKNNSPVILVKGILQNCWLTGGYGYRPGAIALYNGIVRNCLISSNTAIDTYGPMVEFYSATGLVENCTITRNSGGVCNGVWNNNNGGIIRNSIVHGNTSGGANPYQLFFQDKTDIINCCITTNYITGANSPYTTNDNISATGSITNNPQFVNGPGADYRLSQGSPCVNTGTNQGWMMGATDWAGKPRVVGRAVDMGVFEYPARGSVFTIR